MFLFVDGRAIVLTFNQVEQRYYASFSDRFPEAEVSLSQWRGGYEYQTLYPAMQQMVEAGTLTLEALNEVLGSIAAANEEIRRPAVLTSRVTERLAEAGYEATIRMADINTKGTVAICVDQERNPTRILTLGVAGHDPEVVGFNGEGQPFGDLDNRIWNGRTIKYLQTGPTGTTYAVMQFDAPYTSQDADGFIEQDWDFMSGTVVEWYAINQDGTPSPVPGTSQWWRTDQAQFVDVLRGVAAGSRHGWSFSDENHTTSTNGDDEVIGNLIRDEMLPAGQWMEGDVSYDTAISNSQPLTVRWSLPVDTTIQHRVTITRRRGSPYPETPVDDIVALFLSNFDEMMGIGLDLTPDRYLTTSDLPWASSVLVEWTQDGSTWQRTDKLAAYTDRFIASLPPANVVIS